MSVKRDRMGVYRAVLYISSRFVILLFDYPVTVAMRYTTHILLLGSVMTKQRLTSARLLSKSMKLFSIDLPIFPHNSASAYVCAGFQRDLVKYYPRRV